MAGAAETQSRQVHLTSGYQISTVTQRKSGSGATRSSHSSSCYADRDYYDNTIDLDCWWGRYAQADYGFSIPANAHNLSWGISGQQGGCCSKGSITKWGNRPSSTLYRVHVKVTNSRHYIVSSARVTYTYRHRI